MLEFTKSCRYTVARMQEIFSCYCLTLLPCPAQVQLSKISPQYGWVLHQFLMGFPSSHLPTESQKGILSNVSIGSVCPATREDGHSGPIWVNLVGMGSVHSHPTKRCNGRSDSTPSGFADCRLVLRSAGANLHPYECAMLHVVLLLGRMF